MLGKHAKSGPYSPLEISQASVFREGLKAWMGPYPRDGTHIHSVVFIFSIMFLVRVLDAEEREEARAVAE